MSQTGIIQVVLRLPKQAVKGGFQKEDPRLLQSKQSRSENGLVDLCS